MKKFDKFWGTEEIEIYEKITIVNCELRKFDNLKKLV